MTQSVTEIKTETFTAVRVVKNRWDESKGFEWRMTFKSAGIFKSLECRLAERCGVRYASHRKGYVASQRALNKFIAELAA
jgi:hypothetical protein